MSYAHILIAWVFQMMVVGCVMLSQDDRFKQHGHPFIFMASVFAVGVIASAFVAEGYAR